MSSVAEFKEVDGCLYFRLLVHKTSLIQESEFFGPASPEHVKGYPAEYKAFVDDKAARLEALIGLRVQEELDKERSPEEVVKAEMLEAS